MLLSDARTQLTNLRKRWDMIPAGTVERGERKQTADELSKADYTSGIEN
jgi:hypothetical protein